MEHASEENVSQPVGIYSPGIAGVVPSGAGAGAGGVVVEGAVPGVGGTTVGGGSTSAGRGWSFSGLK